jgi:hypothetical protein
VTNPEDEENVFLPVVDMQSKYYMAKQARKSAGTLTGNF